MKQSTTTSSQPDLDPKLHSLATKKTLKFNRENIIRKHLQLKLTDIYEIGCKIGSGAFSEVFKIRHKQLNTTHALKIIKKNQKVTTTAVEEELSILKQLDHPTVLKVYQYFENQYEWQIVTEYFQGRELFQLISAQKFISEKKAAIIFAEICKALAYIHSHHIVHRDLKPENILVKKNGENEYVVKLIDWGLGSKAVKQLIRKCGTPEYCAPEVLKGSYGCQCDLWSLGVVLFVMLIGKFPFKGKTPTETLGLVLRGDINLKGPQWQNISIDAKILISKLLQKDPKKRIKAAQCLQQPWVLNNLANQQQQQQINLNETLQNLIKVNYDNKFQAIVINMIHNYLRTSEQQVRLKKQFEELDTNKDGVLNFDEIKQAYEKVYSPLQAEEITEQIFRKIDLDKSSYLQYNQFITFGTKINTQFTKQQLKQVFKQFDEDYDGLINQKQLSNLISYEKLTQSQCFRELIEEIDQNGDGMIDIDQLINNVDKFVRKVLKKQDEEKSEVTAGRAAGEEYFWEDLISGIIENTKTSKQIDTFSNLIEKEYKQQQHHPEQKFTQQSK